MALSLAYTDPRRFFSPAFMTCQQGTFSKIQPYLAMQPIQWNVSKNVICGLNEVCQETLLLIDVGACAVQEGETPHTVLGVLPSTLSPEFPTWCPHPPSL